MAQILDPAKWETQMEFWVPDFGLVRPALFIWKTFLSLYLSNEKSERKLIKVLNQPHSCTYSVVGCVKNGGRHVEGELGLVNLRGQG